MNKLSASHEPLAEIKKQFHELSRDFDGQSYHFLVANQSSKKAIILLHGVTGNKLDMVVLGRHLAEQGYAVYAPDLPGHGSALAMQATSFNDFGIWLRDCIASLGIEPVMVIGNSFGSAVCYNYAQQGFLPAGSQLILNCPTPNIGRASRLLRYAGQTLPPRLAIRIYNSRFMIYTRIRYLHVSGQPAARAWLRESEYTKRGFIDAHMPNRMSALLESQNPFLGPQLPRSVQERTLYIVGDRDNVTTKTTLGKLKEIMPHAEHRIVPQVGHILHFDAWEACGDIAVEQLKGVGSTA